MCGPFFFGFWWVLPIVAMALCLAFMAFAGRGAGRGFTCMGTHGNKPDQGAPTATQS